METGAGDAVRSVLRVNPAVSPVWGWGLLLLADRRGGRQRKKIHHLI